ncbi:bifunctional folylpolyglutamate synthase/dihydrofolate synthase [Caminicella sporogenes]|uniref:bifunctional folylpolyglutamate synthase/dihydrofolate synthase n=1 Tax=Caminicella sporogenes TaxID=166485 RepID=UPI002540D3CA|nr:Mur ligase family protein [Caminicella sporogenes]WIF95987.1 Mur ligase family protein [Caminicella sporogenes]
MFKSCEEVIDFIYSSYMNKKDKIDKNLNDKFTRNPYFTRKLIDELGEIDKFQRNILVTGSKGKGSICRITAKILEKHGLKVGVYTSPHLTKYNERIKINDKFISDEELIKYANIIEPLALEIEKNAGESQYFGPVGIGAAIALMYFKDNNTDINILECGRGARYDDVAVINSEYSVINKVFLEHYPQLGNTLDEVAYNKAGIIHKNHKAVFIAEQYDSVNRIINNIAYEKSVKVYTYNRDFKALNIVQDSFGIKFDIKTKRQYYKDIYIPVYGEFNVYNACLGVKLCEEILGKINKNKLQIALNSLSWQGCTEIVKKAPLVILDGCINRECAKYLKKMIENLKVERKYFIIGIPDTKDYKGVVEELRKIADKIILTRPKNTHLKFTDEQKLYCIKENDVVIKYEEIFKKAVIATIKSLNKNDILCIVGTQALIGESKKIFSEGYFNE